jgi:glycosyltransferase involved in cell wall biosynthesis
MKILHITLSDVGGGANRSAIRLHNSLQSAGIQSKVLVAQRNGSDPNVIGPHTLAGKIAHNISNALEIGGCNIIKKTFQVSQICSLSLVPSKLKNEIDNINPDIVNLHFVNLGALSIRQIRSIKYPVVWTLHDCWPLSGIEHIPMQFCSEFCNRDGIRLKLFGLFSKLFMLIKRKAFKNVKFISPSKFLKNESIKHGLEGNYKITHIPNPIDTSFWRPEDKDYSRKIMGLSKDQNVLLCCLDGKLDGFNTKVKGFHLVEPFFAKLNKLGKKIKVIVIGKTDIVVSSGEHLSVTYLNRLSDDISLKIVYSSADCLVHFSLWENLPNTVLESIACGVPAVAFKQTGAVEIIEHEKTGYLAKHGDVDDLIIGVSKFIPGTSGLNSENIRLNCFNSVNDRFSSKTVADLYIKYYKTVLTNI